MCVPGLKEVECILANYYVVTKLCRNASSRGRFVSVALLHYYY